MYERLLKTIGSLGAPKVLVAGDFMLDVYVYGDAVRISPEAPVPVLRVTETEYRCGGAASVAADLAALGATPICVGLVGRDAEGRRLEEMLTRLGADVGALHETADRPTVTKQRLIGLARATDLVLTGRMVAADEALALGLVSRVADDAAEAALALAQQCARNAPVALGLAKEALMRGVDVTLPQGLEIEADLFGLAVTTDDAKEGIASFFAKRDPEYRGS